MKKPSVPQAKVSQPQVKDKVLAALQKLTSDKKGDPLAEFSRMSSSILSDVSHVLMIGNKVYDSITGALPFGRIIEVYGIDASGKTALAKKAGIGAQLKNIYKRVVTFGADSVKRTTYEKLDPDKIDTHVLYIDNEQSFSDDNSLTIEGIKADFILGRCDTIGQIFDAVERVVKVVEESSKDSDREQFILVVIDTIASTSTDGELTQEWGAQDFSRHAKELRGAFRRMSRAINKHNVCLLCINQVSDSFAQKAKKNPNALPDENDYATFGGRALKFYASQRIFVQKVPKKFKLHPDNKLEDGLLIEMKTVKNRVKKPLRKGRMVLLFGDEDSAGGGFSELYSMLETFLMLDMAKDEAGTISFRFQANGVTPSTFESKRANPSIDARIEWPGFYNAHKVDFDALWAATEKKIFSSESHVDLLADDDDDDEIFGKKKKSDDEDLI
jgi:recombination protein RecA